MEYLVKNYSDILVGLEFRFDKDEDGPYVSLDAEVSDDVIPTNQILSFDGETVDEVCNELVRWIEREPEPLDYFDGYK